MSNPSTRPQASSHNPFRTPHQTPNPTGASTTSSASSYLTSLPYSQTSLTPAPTGMSTMPSAQSYQTVPEPDVHSDDEDTPEALPDLTPRLPPRNPPNRPLASLSPPSNDDNRSQSAPLMREPPALPPRSSSNAAPPPPASAPPSDFTFDLPPDDIPESAPPAYSLTPDIGGGETVVEQGPRRPFQRAPEPLIQLPPPVIAYPDPSPPGSFPERPLSQLSDRGRPPPLVQQPRYAPPPGPPPSSTPGQQQSRYAPPSGPPPPPSRPRAASTSRGAGSTAPPTSDGYPTTTPTPGHPLLRNGQTLVYPESYKCHKCNNTGYKNFDPSHACRKCWERFGKLFSSILASSPWGDRSSSATSQSQNGRTFQQPLPAFKPPQAAAPPVQTRPPPPSGGGFVMPVSPTSPTGPMVLPHGARPPPGAPVVMPGDSRLGGRRCWRCGGRGTTPFLIFDELTCETCGGVGRLFN
ncbi:hypothetical protein EI94DRAFT_1726695 [Lactarius quietus]|nr:hypothetical protein EI94DRAFT_1726695 [Lactarius quietus]